MGCGGGRWKQFGGGGGGGGGGGSQGEPTKSAAYSTVV
jgi:hypothetical protein